MNIAQVEANVQKLMKSLSKETFIYDLLLAYGLPKASITRLQKGNLNLSKKKGELSWKQKVVFREEFDEDLHITVSDLAEETKHNQRFAIATDYDTLLAIDNLTEDKLDIDLKDLPKHYDFFLPWAGMEKAQLTNENPADIKAAERMARLFDEIKRDNPGKSPKEIHELNVFLSRLLFCFFAEDTNIFKENQFTLAISSHTQEDGSDLSTYLDKLFLALNTNESERKKMPGYLAAFPYVNGGLFKERISIPTFTRRSRQAIIDSGELDWSAINPDIFGSMMQAVVTPEQRGGVGMHYTSVTNIMKVIEPLFLNELNDEFEKGKGNTKRLSELLKRIRKIRIFDPACGSGNFLIITYKELRKLEMRIFKEINVLPMSGISLSQFYGIEIEDFAHEIAQLSLWLAEHQMNVEFFKEFGRTNPTLPLKESGNIVRGNACWLQWDTICPITEAHETYVLGNPPYLGARVQKKVHKADMAHAFIGTSHYKDLDYIACWFYKGAKYISNSSSELAFVSTNSICQGDQVALLWPKVFDKVAIRFAHSSFKWTNNAKGNAGVIVVIVGLTSNAKKKKYIISDSLTKQVDYINAYLVDGSKVIVTKRTKPLSNFPPMSFGNMPNDGGGLILSDQERKTLLEQDPTAERFIRRLMGASEFIRGEDRYCLWIEDNQRREALENKFIQDRVAITQNHRMESDDAGTRELAERPHQFRDRNEPRYNSIIIPRQSSINRDYIPSGFLDSAVIVHDSAQAIYDPAPYILGIIMSNMHMAWVRAVAGRLKTDYRYSKKLCYNTFPFPAISEQHKQEIAQCVFRILEAREKCSEMTLARLYDPRKMPQELRAAHLANDEAVERCYRPRPFLSDEERLAFLFKLYEQMLAEEKNRGTLFELTEITRKKRK